MSFLPSELLATAPIVILAATSLVVLLFESLLKKSEPFSYAVSLIGLGLSAIVSLIMIDMTGVVFNTMINVGGFGNLLGALFLIAALLTIVLSREYLNKEHSNFGEYYLLILFSTLGMMLMASAADLIMIFLGLELMSVCLYVLAGFLRQRQISNESSLKYFLLGAFATGFLLYGIALLYGASGTTNIRAIAENFSGLSSSPFLWVGIGMLLVGLGFKVGAVPFHMWIPDVYQGSPTPVSGFMSTGSKAAAFAALLLVFSHQQIQDAEKLKLLLSIMAAATMILGNVVAIAQSNLKRMLAYSSIAHAGYMLTGLAASNELGHTGILFYLVTYTFMSIGAFGILSLLEREGEKNLSYEDYAGLGSKRPVLAALMAIFMFSLAGIPPFAGFFGKYYVFTAAVNAHLTWLAIIGVLTSVISVYYYLRLVMVMYFREGDMQITGSISRASFAVMAIAALAIIELGVFPSSILSLIYKMN